MSNEITQQDTAGSQLSFHKIALYSGDILAGGAILGSLLQMLPALAALVGLIFYTIQIWESRTVQHWHQNRKMVRKARKISRLKAKEKVIVAQLEALETLRQARVTARDKVEIAKVEAAKLVAQETTAAAAKDVPPLLES